MTKLLYFFSCDIEYGASSGYNMMSPLFLNYSKASHLRLASFMRQVPDFGVRRAGGVFRRADFVGQIYFGRASR